MRPPGAPSLANHKRPRATAVPTHNLREQVLRRAGLVAAGTIIVRTKNNGWLLDLSDEDLRTAIAAGGAYLAADTLTWRGVDIWILCIHRIHGPEDARIVAAGNPNTEKKERQVHGNPGRIAARHTKSGRNMNQERTAVDGGRQGV